MKLKKVLVSVTYSKSTEVSVPDNYTEEDLKNAVKKQCYLPKEILESLAEEAKVNPTRVYPNFKGEVFEDWWEDEFEVVEE
jgi:hypothetical protein